MLCPLSALGRKAPIKIVAMKLHDVSAALGLME